MPFRLTHGCKQMKLVFMGTPEFACATLACLSGSDHEIMAVVTGLDKPTGRRQRLSPTPIAVEAEQRGLPVIKAGSLKSEKLYQQLKELEADLFIVCAFRILPPKLFNLPRLGSINIHTSLLPKYQGAAPINWAIINGEKETGLTSFFLNEQVDRGDIILQEKTIITPTDTYDTLHQQVHDNKDQSEPNHHVGTTSRSSTIGSTTHQNKHLVVQIDSYINVSSKSSKNAQLRLSFSKPIYCNRL